MVKSDMARIELTERSIGLDRRLCVTGICIEILINILPVTSMVLASKHDMPVMPVTGKCGFGNSASALHNAKLPHDYSVGRRPYRIIAAAPHYSDCIVL